MGGIGWIGNVNIFGQLTTFWMKIVRDPITHVYEKVCDHAAHFENVWNL